MSETARDDVERELVQMGQRCQRLERELAEARMKRDAERKLSDERVAVITNLDAKFAEARDEIERLKRPIRCHDVDEFYREEAANGGEVKGE